MVIQFNRHTGFEGTFSEAVQNIKTHCNLQPGEPMICSYKESDGDIRWFLAVGTSFKGISDVKIFPAFTDFEDFSEFVKKKVNIEVTPELELSDQSDVEITDYDSDNKPILKIKGELSGNVWEVLQDKDTNN